MAGKSKQADWEQGRRDRPVKEEYEHDSYRSRGKLPEPTICPDCKAVYHKGRWTWGAKPAEAHEERCPACHRIHDKYPAGYLTLSGPFFKEHKKEILKLAHNEEVKAKAEHPLRRIIAIQEEEGGIVITTTDTHLPRGIGAAVTHAFHGDFHFRYSEEQKLIRANWTR